MRKFFGLFRLQSIICAFVLFGLIAAPFMSYAEFQGYVEDNALLISEGDKTNITDLLTELDQKTSAQIAVVTVDTVTPETIESYAVKLFEKLGIGQKGKDNGVLFLIAKNDHRVRIETGYGLEGALPDITCQQIINSVVVPAFKQGQFSHGIVQGVDIIARKVAHEYNVTLNGVLVDQELNSDTSSSSLAFLILLLGLIIFFVLLSYSDRFPGSGYSGGYRHRYNHWSSGSGGFGGGFGSGGFGGFGGGMSGGGGASGQW